MYKKRDTFNRLVNYIGLLRYCSSCVSDWCSQHGEVTSKRSIHVTRKTESIGFHVQENCIGRSAGLGVLTRGNPDWLNRESVRGISTSDLLILKTGYAGHIRI
jgi:hypothetical protein